MNIKEQIRAEIERRMFEDYNGPDAEQNETAQGVCAGLLFFLDTLPEQPVEGLEEAAEEYEHIEGHFYYPSVKDAFKAGAEWMKSKMPKWYKVEKDGMLDKPTQFILSAKEGYFFCTGDYISRDGYAIFVDELEKLPKEDEK